MSCPSCACPARVLQAAGWRLGQLLAEEARDREALLAERAASRHGRTLETHLLATALLLGSGG